MQKAAGRSLRLFFMPVQNPIAHTSKVSPVPGGLMRYILKTGIKRWNGYAHGVHSLPLPIRIPAEFMQIKSVFLYPITLVKIKKSCKGVDYAGS